MDQKDVPESVSRLITLMHEDFRESELNIATALAAADGSLTIEELAEETGYTERTVKKRVGTLEERLHGEPFLKRDEDGNPTLHPEFANAIRQFEADSA